MNLTQDQLIAVISTVGFTVAYLIGKVIEGIFKKKGEEFDLGAYVFLTGLGALASLIWLVGLFWE